MKINRQISIDGRKTERIEKIHRMLGLKSNFGGLFTGRYNGYKTSETTPDGIGFTFHFTEKVEKCPKSCCYGTSRENCTLGYKTASECNSPS